MSNIHFIRIRIQRIVLDGAKRGVLEELNNVRSMNVFKGRKSKQVDEGTRK